MCSVMAKCEFPGRDVLEASGNRGTAILSADEILKKPEKADKNGQIFEAKLKKTPGKSQKVGVPRV